MGRPPIMRRIFMVPRFRYFSPCGVNAPCKEEIILRFDELEAIRLADLEGLYQEEAAKKMGISRQTFGNILDSAHKKVAQFLIEGKSLRIEGGPVKRVRAFFCDRCGEEVYIPPQGKRKCPRCRRSSLNDDF